MARGVLRGIILAATAPVAVPPQQRPDYNRGKRVAWQVSEACGER